MPSRLRGVRPSVCLSVCLSLRARSLPRPSAPIRPTVWACGLRVSTLNTGDCVPGVNEADDGNVCVLCVTDYQQNNPTRAVLLFWRLQSVLVTEAGEVRRKHVELHGDE